jgi:trans-2,3-dihydro-3-hydroxyanthranilate isomerase
VKRQFVTLDVFTSRRLTGNPLAVVLDAQGLETAAMQAIANEFNLSETVFVLPAERSANRARLRIFTPARELPFAGHPTVGTAVLLACRDGGTQERRMVLEENFGHVTCSVMPAGDRGQATFDLPSLPKDGGPPPSANEMAAGLGLAGNDIGFGPFVPSCWSVGNAFVFVPLASLDAIRRAKPAAQFASVFAARGAFLFCKETADLGRDFHARMFAPQLGVTEDPATGSAAAAFAGVLARFAGLGDGGRSIAIEQGYEMGRPSLIRLGIMIAGGSLTAGSIGGDAVIVAEGTIEA